MRTREGLSRNRATRGVVAVVLSAVAVTSLLAPEAGAGKRPARVEVEHYELADLRGRIIVDVGDPGVSFSEVEFYPRAADRTVSIVAEDDTGLPVKMSVTHGEVFEHYCGKTPEPLRVTSDDEVRVAVFFGPCNGAAAAATDGTVTATFR